MDVKKRVSFLSWVVGIMAFAMVAGGLLFKAELKQKIDTAVDKIQEEDKTTGDETTGGDDVVTQTVNNMQFYA